MITPAYDLFSPPPDAPPAAPRRAQRAKSSWRCLTLSTPLASAYATRGAWVRALLDEYQNANDCLRRCKCYGAKATTSPHERFQQAELMAHHNARMEQVVLALTAALA